MEQNEDNRFSSPNPKNGIGRSSLAAIAVCLICIVAITVGGIKMALTGETNLVWEQYLSEPQVSVSEANIQIKGKTNLSGFHGLAANKDYLFATYSGIYYSAFIDQKDPDACTPQTLVVFKPDGQIVGKYSFSNRSTRICLSEDNSKLYLWNTLPEVGIERHNVKDILNAK